MKKQLITLIVGFFLISIISCKKESTKNLPILTTIDLSDITQTSAKSGGIITSDGGAAVSGRGICWSILQSPTIADNKTNDGSGLGNFISSLTGLAANTTYYVRAYATNSSGTAYGSQVTFKTLTNGQIVDFDGNVYDTVKIGTQIWLRENLKVTHYNNGDAIPLVSDNTTWKNLTSGAYCMYNNLDNNGEIYGYLYNSYTVIDSRKICPTGWRVPSNDDWDKLAEYLGGNAQAGAALKDNHYWTGQNLGSTNSSGFTAIPSGGRSGTNGTFYNLTYYAYWWSSTYYSSSTDTWGYIVQYLDNSTNNITDSRKNGWAIRCIKE